MPLAGGRRRLAIEPISLMHAVPRRAVERILLGHEWRRLVAEPACRARQSRALAVEQHLLVRQTGKRVAQLRRPVSLLTAPSV